VALLSFSSDEDPTLPATLLNGADIVVRFAHAGKAQVGGVWSCLHARSASTQGSRFVVSLYNVAGMNQEEEPVPLFTADVVQSANSKHVEVSIPSSIVREETAHVVIVRDAERGQLVHMDLVCSVAGELPLLHNSCYSRSRS
jgi:precorrin-3B methylase